jgi:hypothetical protein
MASAMHGVCSSGSGPGGEHVRGGLGVRRCAMVQVERAWYGNGFLLVSGACSRPSCSEEPPAED